MNVSFVFLGEMGEKNNTFRDEGETIKQEEEEDFTLAISNKLE